MPDNTDAGRPRPRVRADATVPSNRQLTKLGELFSDVHLRSGLTQEAYLLERGFARRTWWRLLYGLLSEDDKAPSTTVIARYARRAGIDVDLALRVANEVFDLQPNGPLTALGVELERCRLHTDETTEAFVRNRGLAPATWYRLLYGGVRPPRRDIVVKYAKAAGLDPRRALDLAGLGRASEWGPTAPPIDTSP